VSHDPADARFAMSVLAPALSAHTYMLLTCARRATLPPPRSTSVNRSQAPTEAAFAISGFAPALAAETYMLFARARSAIVLPPPPPPVVMRTEEMASLPPVAPRLALSAVNVH